MPDEILPDLQKLTAKQRAHLTYMVDVARRVEWDLHNAIDRGGFIPEAWHDIAKATPVRARVKMTMRVEEDVLRFFRSMGEGHLSRMADVLKTYMHARLAGVLRGADTINHFRVREDSHSGPRPPFGAAAEFLGAPWEDLPPPEGTGIPVGQEIAELHFQIAQRERAEQAADKDRLAAARRKRRAMQAARDRGDRGM
jgi:uncharacterized protein (DUF4415 family)